VIARQGLGVARTTAIAIALTARAAAASDSPTATGADADARSPTGTGADADEGRVPLPEPLLTETVTDIDGSDRGEVEVEANGANLRALRGGGYSLDASLEVEWLVTRHFGVRGEPTLSEDWVHTRTGAAGISGGASWKILQDFRQRLYVDAELLARIPSDASPIVEPGDPASPLAADVRGGLGRGPVTLRWSAGVGIAPPQGHVPLRGSVALLAPFEESGRFGFWGIELDADGSRSTPVVVALDVVPNFAPAGLPFRLGLALPWVVGSAADQPSVGIFVRLLYESAREIEFATRAR
jgi:hypothetical protein